MHEGIQEANPRKIQFPGHMLQEDNFLWIAIDHTQVDGFFRGAHDNAGKAGSAAYIENPKGNTLRNNLENGKGIKEMKDGNISRIAQSG